MRLPVPVLACFALLVPALAFACFTTDRARILDKQHPDRNFEDLAHQMHLQESIDYDFRGPADCSAGSADGFDCRNISLAGWLSLEDIGGGTGSDNWGWVHRATGRMFALMGRSNGVAFVEVTDPEDPKYLGNLPRPDGVGTSVWTDLKTYQNHAFIVADQVSGQGIQVFDLTRLLDVDPDHPETFDEDAHYTGFSRAHNIAINEDSGHAYAVGSESCSGGLIMVDISEPNDPQSAGCFAADSYTHDVQCVNYDGPDADYQGREICLASNEDTLTIVDVTDKTSPQLVARHGGYSDGYVHQGWLTEDQRYFLLDDELDEVEQSLPGTRTMIFDLADLDDAPPPAEYLADGLSIDHNQYVIGDFVFQANYERGLRILRIDDAQAGELTEVAYFDTYPESDTASFSGAWSVFPYFGNEYVMVSDFNRGLFILRVDDPEVVKAIRDAVFGDRFAP